MSSIIATVRQKYLEAIRSVNPPGRWKIMVVDEHAQKLLGSVLKQFDVLEENVSQIESITSFREPQPQFEAMYLLMPTTQNVRRVIKDFSAAQKQYAGAHLFFTEGLDETLFNELTSSPAEPYLLTLKELYLNFWPTEAQTFSLKSPEVFFSMFSPPRDEAAFTVGKRRLEQDLKFIARRITNVCITLDEYPYVRYYFPSHHPPLGALKPHSLTRPPPPTEAASRWRTNLARGSEARAHEEVEADFLTKLLAFLVQHNLDEYKKHNPDWPKALDPPRPRGTLIITDRSMDMMAPFVHEFTYQAMANDLLPITNGKYTYKFQSSVGAYEDKTATLSDQDTVWTEVRHMHMKEAIDKLMADFNKFVQEHAGFQGEGAGSLNDMKDMLASLPQYQEQREKFSLHLNMAQECMRLFEKDKLPAVANIEQVCATGLTAEGKSPKSLVEEMVPLLDSREIINLNKVRIVVLYIQYRDGVPDEDRRRLYQHARLSLPEQDAVNAIALFGIRIGRTPTDRDSNKKRIRQKPNNDEEYDLSRFKPTIKTVIEDHVANKLDQTLFPYVKESPSSAPLASRPVIHQTTSLRSQKASWHRAAKPNAQLDLRQRIIVFIAGGMTYSEVREAYQLSTSLNKEIIIGSTHEITPKQFVDDLKVLELGGVGSKALPNGLRENVENPGERTYQKFYDELYYTQDAPPQLAPSRDSGRQKPGLFPSQPQAASPAMSTHSLTPSRDDKKKKKGLFRF